MLRVLGLERGVHQLGGVGGCPHPLVVVAIIHPFTSSPLLSVWRGWRKRHILSEGRREQKARMWFSSPAGGGWWEDGASATYSLRGGGSKKCKVTLLCPLVGGWWEDSCVPPSSRMQSRGGGWRSRRPGLSSLFPHFPSVPVTKEGWNHVFVS